MTSTIVVVPFSDSFIPPLRYQDASGNGKCLDGLMRWFLWKGSRLGQHDKAMGLAMVFNDVIYRPTNWGELLW